MSLVNRSKIKEKTELNISEEFEIELEKKIEDVIKEAEKRAKANGRRTLYGRDL
jgi:histone H3/H4